MPDLHLYMADADDVRIATWALELGCSVIPDLDYGSREYTSITTVTDYQAYRERTRAFFLLADSFLRCPLEVRQIQKDGKTVFYIYPRSGGPTIQFSAGGSFEQNAQQFLRPGEIGYYLTYENTLTHKNATPPRELVATYRSLAKRIKQVSTSVKLGKHSQVFWLGEDALKAVRNGAKLVGFEEYDVARLIFSRI